MLLDSPAGHAAADRTVFLNGGFVALRDARIPVMDRGFLCADAIYEVSAVLDGALTS